MTERLILAGYGGQGIMTLGYCIALSAMRAGKQVTYFPSYGAAVRGGTANCHVTYSDEPIYLTSIEQADSLIIMNQPSYEKFRPLLKADGLLVINSSMVKLVPALEKASRGRVISAAATDIANELKNVRVANSVMLGAYNTATGFLPKDTILSVIVEEMGHRPQLLDANLAAMHRGEEAAKKT